jgi:hypothetical protein
MIKTEKTKKIKKTRNNDFKFRVILAAFAFSLVLALSVALDLPSHVNANQAAANAAAGSADDPLISLSYLNSATSYTVVELKQGQKLRAKSNSLEIILRQGGTAVVISPFKNQGIADLTAGVELQNGEKLPVNHALLIPRADGRGISVTSDIAYIMARGDYEIY